MPLRLYCTKHLVNCKSDISHKCNGDDGACKIPLKRICTLCYAILPYSASLSSHTKCSPPPGSDTVVNGTARAVAKTSLPAASLANIPLDLSIHDWYQTSLARRAVRVYDNRLSVAIGCIQLIYHCPSLARALLSASGPTAVTDEVQDALQELNSVHTPWDFNPEKLLNIVSPLVMETETDFYLSVFNELVQRNMSSRPGFVNPTAVIDREHLTCQKCQSVKIVDVSKPCEVIRPTELILEHLPYILTNRKEVTEADRKLTCNAGSIESRQAGAPRPTGTGGQVGRSSQPTRKCDGRKFKWKKTVASLGSGFFVSIAWDKGTAPVDNILPESLSDVIPAIHVHDGDRYQLSGVLIGEGDSGNGGTLVCVRARDALHCQPVGSDNRGGHPWISLPERVHQTLSTPWSPYRLRPDHWYCLQDGKAPVSFSFLEEAMAHGRRVLEGSLPRLVMYNKAST